MRKTAKFTTALITAAAIGLTSVTAASATPEAGAAEGNDDCGSAHVSQETSGADRDTVEEGELKKLNADIEAAGGKTLPEGTIEYGFNDKGDAVAVDADGKETVLDSAASMESQLSSPETQTLAAEKAGDKGVLSGAAASIAGCVGGVVGYDAILSILEKRVSYWALVKFLGGKIGPGLAISCIAGAGGGLATYMGW